MKNREIAALEMAAAKIELDLKGRKAAFFRVNSSLSKHVYETLKNFSMNTFNTILKTGRRFSKMWHM